MLVGAHIGHFSRFQETLRMACMAPLSDKAAIIRDDSRIVRTVHLECTFHIPGCGGRKDIEPVVVPCRKAHRIVAALHCVLNCPVRESELHSPVCQSARKKIGSIGIALAVKIGISMEGVI